MNTNFHTQNTSPIISIKCSSKNSAYSSQSSQNISAYLSSTNSANPSPMHVGNSKLDNDNYQLISDS